VDLEIKALTDRLTRVKVAEQDLGMSQEALEADVRTLYSEVAGG
jgi:hypothetical protein